MGESGGEEERGRGDGRRGERGGGKELTIPTVPKCPLLFPIVPVTHNYGKAY